MINIDTIEKEILDLEKRDTSYATIERLAWLYIVRDHMIEEKRSGIFQGSEFCEACSGVPMQSLMTVLSDHMDALAVTFPKEYEAMIGRIKNL